MPANSIFEAIEFNIMWTVGTATPCAHAIHVTVIGWNVTSAYGTCVQDKLGLVHAVGMAPAL